MVAPLVIVAGFLLGLAVTLLGGGGGVFYLAVLLVVVELPYAVAVPTSLATVIATTAFGSLGHARRGNVAADYGLAVVAGAVGGAYLGARVVGAVSEGLLTRMFGGFLVVVAALLYLLDRRPDAVGAPPPLTPLRAVFAVGLGAATGLLSATFGISGTPALLPGLYALGLPAAAVVGTSVFCILGVSMAGVAWYATLLGVRWDIVVPFGASAAVGALVAPRILDAIPEARLEAGYGPVLVGVTALTGIGFLLGIV
ncbi:sulfite exporter TauE/SafE family protein [Halosegnis sp.]|uniref:sulfite exporter TauE/SafE family protein n=1 Tax=Halosegnis sp. TaxID=2864959 RepID=UPI0035D4B7DA